MYYVQSDEAPAITEYIRSTYGAHTEYICISRQVIRIPSFWGCYVDEPVSTEHAEYYLVPRYICTCREELW